MWLISSNGAVTRSLQGEAFHRDLLPATTCLELCAAMKEFRGNMVVTFDKESKGALVLERMDELTSSIRHWLEKNMQYIEFVVPIENALVDRPCSGHVLRSRFRECKRRCVRSNQPK